MVRKRKQEKFTCFYHIFRGKKTKSIFPHIWEQVEKHYGIEKQIYFVHKAKVHHLA
jgi:hypothetical protein